MSQKTICSADQIGDLLHNEVATNYKSNEAGEDEGRCVCCGGETDGCTYHIDETDENVPVCFYCYFGDTLTHWLIDNRDGAGLEKELALSGDPDE